MVLYFGGVLMAAIDAYRFFSSIISRPKNLQSFTCASNLNEHKYHPSHYNPYSLIICKLLQSQKAAYASISHQSCSLFHPSCNGLTQHVPPFMRSSQCGYCTTSKEWMHLLRYATKLISICRPTFQIVV